MLRVEHRRRVIVEIIAVDDDAAWSGEGKVIVVGGGGMPACAMTSHFKSLGPSLHYTMQHVVPTRTASSHLKTL